MSDELQIIADIENGINGFIRRHGSRPNTLLLGWMSWYDLRVERSKSVEPDDETYYKDLRILVQGNDRYVMVVLR